ncbi:right-handed parallel beta-helix repeat-containing protein [Baekduia sp. Peel2402]|uniref:right-handed parallel beta-helix repeat-containing protein n=1 Tax=Baekduia sp. Peel2402 TaxID=3458296 RepID=UPI00403EDAFD
MARSEGKSGPRWPINQAMGRVLHFVVLMGLGLSAAPAAAAAAPLPARAKVTSVAATGAIAARASSRRLTLRLVGTAALRPTSCGAPAAVAALRRRLVGRTVTLRGRQGAARLGLAGTDVTRWALTQGLLQPAAGANAADRAAATRARRAGRGLWGCRGASTPAPTPPSAAKLPTLGAPAAPAPSAPVAPAPAPAAVVPDPITFTAAPPAVRGGYVIGTVTVVDVWVDPVNGSDAAAGTTRATALRTLDAAWQRIPQGQALTTGVRVRILPGTITATEAPNYWEDRWGTASHPVIVQAEDGAGTVQLPPINAYGLRYAYFINIGIEDPNDPFHCERCDHLLIRGATLHGSDAHETLKVNQSTEVYVEGSTIGGADDNAIDFVAVRGGGIRGNTVGPAGDWCAYAKGGSAQLVVQANRFAHCGTGGFVAGQGTGLQFMEAPFTHYEAYGIAVLDNLITDVEGAGVGVNGGFQVLVAHNTIIRAGARGHALEVAYGRRSCDGQPGDEGRERCQQLLNGGAWGTTRVDDGDNFVRIPNRHVFFYNNIVDDPAGEPGADEHVHLDDPYSGPWQSGSGLGPVTAGDDVRFAGNVLWYGSSGLPSGLTGSADTAFFTDNSVNVSQPVLDSTGHPSPGTLPAGTAIPAFGTWDVPGTEPYAGVAADLTYTLDGQLRAGNRPGAF